jgi:hypothetical protein
MNLDKLDIFIIREFAKTYNPHNPDSKFPIDTKWNLSKDYVKIILPGLDEKDKVFLKEVSKIYKKVIYKLERFCDMGFFTKAKNGNNEEYYVLFLDKLKLGKHKFSDGLAECLIVRLTPKIS